MKIYTKKRKLLIISYSAGLIIGAVIALLLLLLDINATVRIIGVLLILFLVMGSSLFLRSRLEHYNNKAKWERVVNGAEKPFITNGATPNDLISHLETLDFKRFVTEENVTVFYEITRRGNIAMPKADKTFVVIFLNDSSLDFLHPEIGMILSKLSNEILKDHKMKNLFVLVVKGCSMINDVLIEDANKVMFFTKGKNQITQINLLVSTTQNKAYFLQNINYYPTKDYQELANFVTIFYQKIETIENSLQ